VGPWDEKTSVNWQRIRDNVCQLKPATIDSISRIIVAERRGIAPEAIEKVRADSFVIETNIHYPTESSLIRDGLEKILSMCVPIAEARDIPGCRQHDHLWTKVKDLARQIGRIAAKNGPNYKSRMTDSYHKHLQKAQQITERARLLCVHQGLPAAVEGDIFGDQTLQAFIVRTERVMDTVRRRVLLGKTVPNCDKLFNKFEVHTQLYILDQAGEPVQFGRQVLAFEDSAGFIIHRSLMPRDRCDADVAVEQTRAVHEQFSVRIQRPSFDRNFHLPGNQDAVCELVSRRYLPKPGAE
jgi:transposase, IS5 family